MLEMMIESAAADLGIYGGEMIILDFAGCLRGIYGMIDQEADCLDIIILDALADFARGIAEARLWRRGGSLNEEMIYDALLFWIGDIL